MKKILSILYLSALCLLLIAPQAARADGASSSDNPTILVLGDSLSAAYGLSKSDGWVALLRQRLSDQGYPHGVFNASISGETTSGGLRRLPDLLDKHSPEIVIIELGANDGLRALSLKAMRDNLQSMVRASHASGAQVLLLGMRIPQNYGAAYAEQFHNSFAQVDEVADVAERVEFFLAPIALKPEYFLEDRLHPNAAAQPLLLEEIWDELVALLPENAKQN